MHQDSIFTIGKSHTICQDYCASGTKEAIPYAIVSDGCSSSQGTDFGSRFLVKAAEYEILAAISRKHFEPEKMIFSIHNNAQNMYKTIPGLDYTCLDATLLFAYKQDNEIIVVCSGDGVISARRKDGTFVVKTIAFKDNAPVYANYVFDHLRKKSLLSTYDCTKTITFYDQNKVEVTEKNHDDFDFFHFSLDEFVSVSLFSDGVETFQKPKNTATSSEMEMIHVVDVIKDLTAYKNYTGTFVQRRTRRFLSEGNQDWGIVHADDLSVATIYTGV
jgi:hypothetical protein